MRVFLAAALLAAATPVLADETEGLVLAYDRAEQVLVMKDMTVWMLPAGTMVPADLGAGDRILIDFTSDGDNGFKTIDAIVRLAPALPQGTDGGS